ncbi:melanocyte-stimulating hormone receptor-like [Oculina patagonica]
MNFSQSSSIASENDCTSFFFETVPLRYSAADSFYGLLVAAAVLSLAACPFTILLNALVIVAVKTKRRLQTHPNILLACLALTDLMVGLVVQPLHITKTIFLLQGKDFHEFCNIDMVFTISFVASCSASLFHLVVISGERFLAIKHTFTHANFVTNARLVVSSVVAWIAAAVVLLVASYSLAVAIALITGTFSSIVLLQIFVYKEAHRHEKQILSHQVSVEARAKFKQEKKALKLTTIILVTLFLCFFLPLIIIFVTLQIFKEKFSPNVNTLVRHFGRLAVIINSVLNPVIYTVRKREFRVAFIELLLRKSFQEAEEYDRRLFGSTDNAGRPLSGQEGEGQEQNAEESNAAHANDNQEDNPEILATGANVDDNTILATQIEPDSSNALNSASKKTEEEHREGRNAANDKNNLEDNSEVLTTGASVEDHTTLATQDEPIWVLSPQMHSTVHPKRQRKNMSREEIQPTIKTNL